MGFSFKNGQKNGQNGQKKVKTDRTNVRFFRTNFFQNGQTKTENGQKDKKTDKKTKKTENGHHTPPSLEGGCVRFVRFVRFRIDMSAFVSMCLFSQGIENASYRIKNSI